MTPRLPLEVQLYILALAIPPHGQNPKRYRLSLLNRLALVHRDWLPTMQNALFEVLEIQTRSVLGDPPQRELDRAVVSHIALATKHGRPVRRVIVDARHPRDDWDLPPLGSLTNSLTLVRQRCPDLREMVVFLDKPVYPFFSSTFAHLTSLKIHYISPSGGVCVDSDNLPEHLEHLHLVQVSLNVRRKTLTKLTSLIAAYSEINIPSHGDLTTLPRLHTLAILEPVRFFLSALFPAVPNLRQLLLTVAPDEQLKKSSASVLAAFPHLPHLQRLTCATKRPLSHDQTKRLAPVLQRCTAEGVKTDSLLYVAGQLGRVDEAWP